MTKMRIEFKSSKRICSQCQKPIRRHDKYIRVPMCIYDFFKNSVRRTDYYRYEHVNCRYPERYTDPPRKKK